MGRSSAEALIGRVVDGKYCLEAYLGGGAMGDVFRARHVKIGRSFAVKILHQHLVSDRKLVARFAREAEVAATLRHPNLVPVLDTGEADGRAFLVMELAPGHTLSTLLDAGVPLARDRVIALVRQLCDGLAYAHDLGLVHRDLKPDNVIVESTPAGDTARIVDFGLALPRDRDGGGLRDRMTTDGIVLGSPHYIAPEVATGGEPDPRADLFALGVICFEMLCGCLPFEGGGVEVAHANVSRATPVMGVRVPGLAVDPQLEAFTRRLMEKDPDARPASAGEARRLLDEIAHGPRVVEPTMRVRALRRRRPAAVAACATLALGLAAIAVVGFGERHRAVAPAPPEPAVVIARALPPPPVAAMTSPAPALPAPTVPVPAPVPAPPTHASITTHVPAPARTPVAPPVAAPRPHDPVPLGLASCSDAAATRPPPPPDVLVSKYVSVGRQLKQRGNADGIDELWQRYRLIRLADALGNRPESESPRARAIALLDDIQRQLERKPR